MYLGLIHGKHTGDLRSDLTSVVTLFIHPSILTAYPACLQGYTLFCPRLKLLRKAEQSRTDFSEMHLSCVKV